MENKLSPHNSAEIYKTLNARYAALRLKQLLLLVSLGELHSLRKVADELSISQPAATKALQEIEEILGVPLFERTTLGVLPTAFGICTIEHAAIVLSTMNRLKSQLDLLGKEGRQLLRIGTIAGAVSDYFGELFGRFSSTDRLMIEAEEDTPENLINKINQGKLDCVFIKRNVGLDADIRIDSETVISSGVCVVAGIKHPLIDTALYEPNDLINYNWIAYNTNTPLSDLLKSWFCNSIGQKPNIWMRTTSTLATISALANSDSLALLPMSVVLTMDRKLIKRIKTNISSNAECCVYWRNDSPVSTLIRQQIDAARPSNVISLKTS